MVRSEKFPKGIGQQVLAAVLLHMVKASLPVYLSLNFGASCHGGFGFMDDVTIFFPDMDYGNSLFSNKKLTCITELTAAFRIEYGLVKLDAKAILQFNTIRYLCLAFSEHYIFVKYFFCHTLHLLRES